MLTLSNINSAESVEEIILDDSDSDSTQLMLPEELKKKGEEISIPRVNNNQHDGKSKSFSEKNVSLRGLLPHERDKSFWEIYNLPVVRRCRREHNYFLKNHIGIFRYNFGNLATGKKNTLQFRNKKSSEHPTIDVECLAAKLNAKLNSVYVNDCLNKNNVNRKNSTNSVSSGSCSKDSLVADAKESDQFPENNSTDSGSEITHVNNCDSVTEIRSDAGETDNQLASESSDDSGVPSNIYKVDCKVEDMQKLLKARCIVDKEKSSKTPPPRLRKMLGQRKSENIFKMSEYVFPMPNLTNVANREKNWRLEYIDDEVQNLGLDDLLLKASELNAENFTKALGRKLEPVKSNFNNKDSSSEIVFTFPKAKKSADDNCESSGDLSSRNNVKSIKLDISKPFFESVEGKETELGKVLEEISPKKVGIKVKTVENINEEFKDSLERLNEIDKEIHSSVDKNNFGVLNDAEKEKTQKESEKNSEGSRPFIMTIIQSKTEKQRPAILRNSYLKKRNQEKGTHKEKIKEKTIDRKIEGKPPPCESSADDEKREKAGNLGCANAPLHEKNVGLSNGTCGEGSVVAYPKMDCEKPQDVEERFSVKKRNIPFILNHARKSRQTESASVHKAPSKLVKGCEVGEKPQPSERTLKITSIEQKLGPKELNRRFIKIVPYEPMSKAEQPEKAAEPHQKIFEEELENPQKDGKVNQILTLTAFSAVLKEILPDKWFLCSDKKHGLQIIKTHMDEFLNPSIMISVVIARCGKLTVNVRGKQLPKSHELFSNLCDISNSDNKLSLNYVLSVLNKLRHRSVCFGCDDPSLKKYWSDDGVVENQTEFQQVYRSQLCQMLVSLGKRRCYPCYRMNESLKKRYRRDRLGVKAKEEKEKDSKEGSEEVQQAEQTHKPNLPARGVKRNLEDFLEESFSTMKKQIVDEIEKNKKIGEREDELKAQEEVLSFMGLARKESLDHPVRKSKRKKNSFYNFQQPAKKKTDQKELEFLEKYWTDINTLFSTSLLFGAYSRTGRSRLREKCKMFQKLLSTWKNIVSSNPEWIGEISLPDELMEGETPLGKDSDTDQFEKMDVPALRAYIINSVKEVNRIKHKLRTRNSYFKILYNKFVKRRIKKPKPPSENQGRVSSATNTPTPTDLSSNENSRDNEKVVAEENKPDEDLVSDAVPNASKKNETDCQ